MGFDKLMDKVFGVEKPTASAAAAPVVTVVKSAPSVVAETQEVDLRADYEQRATRRRGLLSTILSNSNREAGQANSSAGSNTTLG